MRVSVIINPKAGTVDPDKIIQKVSEALFRCDLHFHISKSTESMTEFISQEITEKTDVFVVCGGDGTINTTLQVVMKLNQEMKELPAFCLIRSGTANDLAHEMGISNKIDEAARQILEGKIKKIDVLAISNGEETKYMLTNGGMGIPAITADRANQVRGLLQQMVLNSESSGLLRELSNITYHTIKKMGSSIYTTMLLETLHKWKPEGWDLEVEFLNETKMSTKAPFILVNNQTTVGQKYLPAPFTANDDGQVNLLIIEEQKLPGQLKAIYKVARGSLREGSKIKSFETSEFTVRSKNLNRGITFFGDGEILFRNSNQIKVKCLKRHISMVVKE